MGKHTLDKVVDDPFSATPAQILVALADPFGDLGLTESLQSDLIEVLGYHFVHGRRLVQEMSNNLLAFERKEGGYLEHNVGNAFDLLQLIMKSRPKELDKRLGSLYNRNKAAVERVYETYFKWLAEGRCSINLDEKINGIEKRILLLLYYTSQWHHYIYKKDSSRQNPFSALEDVPRDNVALWLRANSNRGFPDYSTLGWLARVKTFDSAVTHFVRRSFEVMEEEKWGKEKWSKDDFYDRIMAPYSRSERPTIGTDTFGVKIFGSGRSIMGEVPQLQKGVERHLGAYGWEIVKYEDKRSSQDGLGPLIYLVRRKGALMDMPDMPDVLQVQVLPLTNFLLADFYVKSHHVYHIRVQQHLARQKEQHPKLYARLLTSTSEALSFLKK